MPILPRLLTTHPFILQCRLPDLHSRSVSYRLYGRWVYTGMYVLLCYVGGLCLLPLVHHHDPSSTLDIRDRRYLRYHGYSTLESVQAPSWLPGMYVYGRNSTNKNKTKQHKTKRDSKRPNSQGIYLYTGTCHSLLFKPRQIRKDYTSLFTRTQICARRRLSRVIDPMLCVVGQCFEPKTK